MTPFWAAAVVRCAFLLPPQPGAPEPEPFLVVRAVRPGAELERLIALFRGARAPHPAAALAAWKHAGGGRGTLGKPAEAAIAALNPAMVRELRVFDEAVVRVSIDPGSGHAVWRAVLPKDDGAVAAAVSALALTDGATLDPIGGVPVYRTGAAGSPVVAVEPGRLAVASTVESLRTATESVKAADAPASNGRGWYFRARPAGLRGSRSLTLRRVAEAFGTAAVDGKLAFDDDEALVLALTTRAGPGPAGVLSPGWFAGVPSSGVLAAASTAFGGTEAEVDGLFARIDRVEKADPARAGVAPSRVRLNLAAAAARVRPEVEFWPVLRGLTVVVLADDAGETGGLLVGLHAADVGSASRLASVFLPKLAEAFLRAKVESADGVTALGSVADKPLALATRGAGVWIGWGHHALASGLDAVDHPSRSAGPVITAAWRNDPPRRAGAFWPGRFGRLVSRNSSLPAAMEAGPPILWQERVEGENVRDEVVWGGLGGLVRRGLSTLPLEAPPDASTDPPVTKPPRVR